MGSYHLFPESYHLAQADTDLYLPATFDEEGFIHCTTEAAVLVDIANLYFAGLTEPLFVYTIDEARLTSPVKYEPPAHVAGADNQAGPADNILFPHIYGPINRPAIVETTALVRNDVGRWAWPKD
jgi:uncharacterized protein (DUF952 family)